MVHYPGLFFAEALLNDGAVLLSKALVVVFSRMKKLF